MDIGLNLATPSHALLCPFVDRCQTADGPRVSGGAIIGPNGWPIGAGVFSGAVPIDPGTRNYTIVVTRGVATKIALQTPKASVLIKNGLASFDATGDAGHSQAISVTTSAAATEETRFAIVPTELLEQWRADPLSYDPAWLAARRRLSVVRFMDWMQTNNNKTFGYSPSPAGAFGQFGQGMPIDLMVKAAAALDAQAWYPIPVEATDDAVRVLVAGIMATSKRPPHFELGNEVWNAGYAAHGYAMAQAVSVLGAPLTDLDRGYGWYGYRSTQVSRVIQSMGYRVGVDFHMGLGCQPAQPSKAALVASGIAKAGGVNADFDQWLITGYVNGTLTSADDVTLPLVQAKDIAGGVDNILHGEKIQRPDPKQPGKLLPLDQGVSLAKVASSTAQHVAFAKARGWRVVWYEGNIHLNTLPHYADSNITAKMAAAAAAGVTQKAVSDYFRSIYMAPAAASIMAANLQAAQDAGVALAVLFNDSSPWSDNGGFGLIGTPGWDAVQAWLDKKPATNFAGEIAAMRAQLDDLATRITQAGLA